ncbi:hypothetical protein JZ751_022178 [Albula glossodonta]|uniref:Potassium channel domain-containing protein n=1 Tax=Albula glossodonta TaxID=121402 RepID=A0A8T2MZ72_9TELE|nr:hypothetical protein JZ751_022178 [Albula glossodonta]
MVTTTTGNSSDRSISIAPTPSPRPHPHASCGRHAPPVAGMVRHRRGSGSGGTETRCCCSSPQLNEDNARFCLLAALILLYLLCGAAVFSELERPSELRARRHWDERLSNFTQQHRVALPALHALLRQYEEANAAGIRVDTLRPRWDFSGAFYFVGTVVSTIESTNTASVCDEPEGGCVAGGEAASGAAPFCDLRLSCYFHVPKPQCGEGRRRQLSSSPYYPSFGMTTPATIGGKIFLIFYGLIGCAATILFFNLFLERIITMLAYVMRWFHERQVRGGGEGQPRRDGDSLEEWKPSVYYVMLILGVAAVLIACSASALYAAMEDWGYFESLYFCFVAFSTIGFGDLVSSQRAHYEAQGAYRLGNCFFILAGVCCIYSLFNVISIVIKQTLNWILGRLDGSHCTSCVCVSSRGRRRLRCCCCPPCPWLPGKRMRHQLHPLPGHRGRQHHNRNAVHPAGPPNPHTKHRCADVSMETVCDSETDGGGAGADLGDGAGAGRRLSGELISVKDFMATNKVSLAILQKQLSETAHTGPRQSLARHNGFSGGVGAFAIMNNRLQETSVDR